MRVRPFSSFLPMIILALISTIVRAVLAQHDLNMPRQSEMLWSVIWQLLVVCWVYLDRQGRHLRLPFDFDAFVFFAWPLVLPYYLHKSRGLRGVVLTAFLFGLFIFPKVAERIVWLMKTG